MVGKLMGQDKDRKSTDQSLSWAEQTPPGENEFNLFPIYIDLENKKKDKLTQFPPFFSPAQLHTVTPILLPPGGTGDGSCSQSKMVLLSCSFLLTES